MARRVRTALYRYTMPCSSLRGNYDRKPLPNQNQEPSLPPYARTPFTPYHTLTLDLSTRCLTANIPNPGSYVYTAEVTCAYSRQSTPNHRLFGLDCSQGSRRDCVRIRASSRGTRGYSHSRAPALVGEATWPALRWFLIRTSVTQNGEHFSNTQVLLCRRPYNTRR